MRNLTGFVRFAKLKAETISLIDCIVNLMFVFILLPYVSPYPIYSDVQPVAGLLGLILIVLSRPAIDKTLIKNETFIFLLFALFSFCYYLPSIGNFYLKKRVGLFFSFIIFYAIKQYHRRLSIKVFYAVFTFNFFCFVFHCINPVLFVQIFGCFVRTIKLTVFDYRGASGIAPENSFAAFTAIFHLFVFAYFSNRKKISIIYKFLIVSMAVFIVMLSKSVTGVVIGFVLFVCFMVETNRLKWLFVLSVCSCVLLIFPMGFVNEQIAGRGVQVARLLIENPFNIFSDLSITFRIHNVIIGLLSILHFPFGLGGGSFLYASQLLSDMYNIGSLYPPLRETRIIVSGVVSPFSQYLVENGILFPLFIFIMLAGRFRQQNLCLTKFVFIMYGLFFFPIVYPAVWFLLGVSHSIREWNQIGIGGCDYDKKDDRLSRFEMNR